MISVRPKGFTLIELLLTSVILFMVIASIYACFNIGLKAYKRESGVSKVEKIRLGFLDVEKDIKSSFYFSKLPFTGKDREMTLPGMIKKEETQSITAVNYIAETLEGGNTRLLRKEKSLEGELIGTKAIMPVVKDIRFEYARPKTMSSDNFEWKDFWGIEENSCPFAVKVRVEGLDGAVYTKIIFLKHIVTGINR